MDPIIVIGAGQAGASIVEKIRSIGFEGKVILIGDEPYLPYQRPPLSKKYLLGEMEKERLFLRPQSFYDDQNIEVILGTSVSSIDPSTHTVYLSDGQTLTYGKLALATGSQPNLLPAKIGGALDGVFPVRGLSDVDALAPAFNKGGHSLIIGGGYIGLEAAAVAASRGLKVTLVELGDRILQRVAAKETSDFMRSMHTSHGVNILEGVGLDHLVGETHVTGAVLTNGTELDIDFAILGIGIRPNIDLAQNAGLKIDNGIWTNEFGQTSDSDIYAAGDCCSFPYNGDRLRLESVPNAIDQAMVVAQNMLGAQIEYIAKPWFWSDQYDLKLQIAGLNTGFTECVTRAGAREGSQSNWYFKDRVLLSVDAMNDPRSYMIGKRWIEGNSSPDIEDIKNPEIELKGLAVSPN